jgi:large subunit ribosomal protein L15
VNRQHYTIINVSKLAELPANTQVSLELLLNMKILTTNDGPLKILGDGELGVALEVTATAFTKGARFKIEAAGGTCILET